MIVRAVGLKEVEAKLAAAPARILEENRLMVETMLEWVKAETESATPIGPGHFGYHLRDMFTTDAAFKGTKTIGVLKSPPTGYWREFGTRSSSRKMGRALGLTVREGRLASSRGVIGGAGERAFMTAHKALSGARRIIRNFYSGACLWWRI